MYPSSTPTTVRMFGSTSMIQVAPMSAYISHYHRLMFSQSKEVVCTPPGFRLDGRLERLIPVYRDISRPRLSIVYFLIAKNTSFGRKMLEFGISHASTHCSDCRRRGSSEPVPDLQSPIVGGAVAQPPVHQCTALPRTLIAIPICI